MNKQDIFYNYNYLIENDVVKEDARYWLPMGVTTQVMMTFTIENLGKFFKLRLDNHAQKEIRWVAQEMTKHMKLTDREIEIFLNITNTYNCNRQENEEFIVDEEINEEDIESFNINTEEDAKELLEKSDKYNKME
jgi:thymidylate synthase ThyX